LRLGVSCNARQRSYPNCPGRRKGNLFCVFIFPIG
jgi:hypothetical protein